MEYSICFYVSVVWSSAGGVCRPGSSSRLLAYLQVWWIFIPLACRSFGAATACLCIFIIMPPPPNILSPLCRFLLCEFCVCFVVLCCICICAFSFLLWPQTHTHFYLLCLCFSPSHSLSRSLPFSFFAGAFIYIRFLFSTLRCRRIYKYKWVLLDEG